MTNLRIACVAIVKNAQNHVVEWIAYRLTIGFDTAIFSGGLTQITAKNETQAAVNSKRRNEFYLHPAAAYPI